MRVRMLAAGAAILGICLVSPTTARAFNWSKALGGPDDAEQFHTFKLIKVSDLEKLLAKHTQNLHIYDANAPETRKKYGVIPGAKLIDAPSGYRVSTTLPPDKNATLVFYCANSICIASHQAARRAVAAGYTNVNVMGDGIMGWKADGQRTISAAAAAAANKS